MVITIYDYILLPFFLVAFYLILIKVGAKYNGSELKKIFFIGFSLKIIGALLYALVVQYYYGYGDSIAYFMGGELIKKTLTEGPGYVSNFFLSAQDLAVLTNKDNVDLQLAAKMSNTANNVVMKTSALVSIVSFGLYTANSMFFAIFSFAGIWKLFLSFTDVLGKRYVKLLAYVVLYLPSLWFWGSGLNKEGICMGSMGFICSTLYQTIVKKKISLRNVFFMIFNFFLLFTVKSYIVAVLLAAFAVSVVAYFIIARSNIFSKIAATLVTAIVSGLIFSYSLSNYFDVAVKESTAFIETSKTAYATDEDERSVGGFAAGEFDLSLEGLILKTPSAVFTTFFRPFIWETRKPIMLFAALESFIMFCATFYLLLKMRFLRFFSAIFSDPLLVFCFVFSMMIAAIVGLTTFNFGTLVRYRIPLLPFYGFLLVALYKMNKEKRDGITKS